MMLANYNHCWQVHDFNLVSLLFQSPLFLNSQLLHVYFYHMPSKKIFIDQKYLLPLKNYGDFHNSMYLASTTKQALEMEKTTGEDYFYLPYCELWYNIA